MPSIYYVVYTNLTEEEMINKVAFFYKEKDAQKFRNELLIERNEKGGKRMADIYFTEVIGFHYRTTASLIVYLNEISRY